jgi:hypothetical protein
MLASAHPERGKAGGGAAGVRGEEPGTYDPLPKAFHDCGHARKARLSVRRSCGDGRPNWRLASRRAIDGSQPKSANGECCTGAHTI